MSCVLAVGVGLCDCAWQGAEGGSPCPPSPSPTGCLTRSAHTFGAMAAGARDGGEGGGGSKIKLKIKACPESPSAPCRPVGRGTRCGCSPSSATGAGAFCPSVQWLCEAPAWSYSPGPTGPTSSTGRSAINGARGVPGAWRDQRGPKRGTLGLKERPGDRDMVMGTTQETETQTARQRCGDPEMEKGALWRLKTQRPRDRKT